MSSQDSENLEKSLCARDKADNQNWMIFGPLGRTALKTLKTGCIMEIIA